MRPTITIILIIFFNFYSWGQAGIGIGVVSIEFNDKTVLNFYISNTSLKADKTVEFFNDKSSWNIKNIDSHKEWLNPESLSLDFSSFVFRVNQQSENWYEVIVNNETGKKYWIKKTEIVKFLNWEAYFKSMFGISRFEKHKQNIYQQPTDDSKLIYYQGEDCFQVKSMKGDWIEVFTPDYCNEDYTDSKTKIKSGWIRWKKGNKLLIDYFITS